jgi:peroxiredoxin
MYYLQEVFDVFLNLKKITMKLSVGDKAPNFTLYASDKSQVSLDNYKGQNVLVLFFPLAFTGVCTAELCSVRDEMKDYESLNAQVLGISVDSLFTLEQFKASQKYNFPLLSDFNKETSRAYGSLYEEFVLGMKGVSKRSAFVIDGDGYVKYEEVLENAGEVPNFVAIKECLNQL